MYEGKSDYEGVKNFVSGKMWARDLPYSLRQIILFVEARQTI